MANTTKKTSTAANKPQPKPEPAVSKKAEEKPIVPIDVDPNTLVVVRNGFRGKLVYISPRTKEKYVWGEFGDEQEMELRELRTIKSSFKRFYVDNWIMFDDEYKWVIPYLGLTKYYENAIDLDDFDRILSMSEDEIKEAASKLSKGQKRTMSYAAREKIISGEIDSRKVIRALEEALDVELIEK